MLLRTLALLFAPVTLGALQVTSPSADVWWVNESQNVVAWTGTSPPDPAEFIVFLSNSEISLFGSDRPLVAITQTYMQSLAVPVEKYIPGKGYVIKLANILNGTDVYATSEPFEIKPLGTAYPEAKPSAASTASGSPAGSAAPAGSAPAESSKPNAADRNGVSVAAAALGVVALTMI